MNKYALQIAAVCAAAPLALAGCSSSSEGSPSTDSSSGADDRGAVNNSFETFFTANPTGENTLSIITTGYPDTVSGCTNTPGLNEIYIANPTPYDQTFTVTDNQYLANNLTFYSAGEESPSCANNSPIQNQNTYTVPAGKVWSIGVAAGGYQGSDTFMEGQQHNLSIGGGSDPSSWYDLYLSTGLNSAYQHWELGYTYTGGLNVDNGTNTYWNTQQGSPAPAGLFNGVACSESGNGVQMTSQIITPYQNDAQNAWEFTSGDPICFAFIAPGTWPSDVTYVLDGQESNEAPNPGGGFPSGADVWNYVAP